MPVGSGAWRVRVKEHWKLVAGVAGAGVLAVVIAIVALVSGANANTGDKNAAADAEAAPSASEDIEVYAPPGDQEAIKNAIALIDNGDYASGVSQLGELADRYPKRWQAPLRWAFRGALGARSSLVVRSSLKSRRAQAKGRR